MDTTHDESTSPRQVALTEGLGPVELRELAEEGVGMHGADAPERKVCEGLLAALTEIESLRAALKWYADGEHFTKSDPGAWDTVSGEPQNWWCDEAGTAMVEDGSLAGMVLAGKLPGAQLGALEDGEVVKA